MKNTAVRGAKWRWHPKGFGLKEGVGVSGK
jgi:hypothetical protein